MTIRNLSTTISFCLLLMGTLTACFDDKESEYIVTNQDNAIVTSFTFDNNSHVCPNLARYGFTIDNLGQHDPELLASLKSLWNKDEYSLEPGFIFNPDSLPSGTIADSIKVNLSYSSPKEVKFYQYDEKLQLQNCTNFADTQTVSFDDYAITRLEITARDGVTNKSYFVKVNIHQVFGDTLQWHLFADNLFDASAVTAQHVDTLGSTLYWYTQTAAATEVRTAQLDGDIRDWSPAVSINSPATLNLPTLYAWDKTLYGVASDGSLLSTTDGLTWTAASTDYEFVNLLGLHTKGGYTDKKYDEHLCAIVRVGSDLHFAQSLDGQSWQLDPMLFNDQMTSLLPAGFPVQGYSHPLPVAAQPKKGNVTSRIYIVGGITADGQLTSSTWASDGTTWVEFPQNQLPAMQGASIVRYTTDKDHPETLWILQPGIMSDGEVSNRLWFSENSGITWKPLSREYSYLADTTPLEAMGGVSAFHSRKNWNIYFFGGIDANGLQRSTISGGCYRKLTFDKKR